MVKIKRLHHVTIGIEAGREDEARAFYGDALGLAEKRRPMGLKDRTPIWYDIGENEDELHLVRTNDPREEDHLCIEVDDIEGMRTQLAQAGVAVREISAINNRPRFFVDDPFGNAVELVQVTGRFTPVDEPLPHER